MLHAGYDESEVEMFFRILNAGIQPGEQTKEKEQLVSQTISIGNGVNLTFLCGREGKQQVEIDVSPTTHVSYRLDLEEFRRVWDGVNEELARRERFSSTGTR